MKNIIILIIVGLVIIGGIWILKGGNDTNTPINVTDESTSTTTSTNSTGAKSYTMTEVASHNGSSSCWTIIDGGVYDLTSWISQHPGGPGAILSLCGKNGSAAFHGQHDDSPRQLNILATFKIGSLTK